MNGNNKESKMDTETIKAKLLETIRDEENDLRKLGKVKGDAETLAYERGFTEGRIRLARQIYRCVEMAS